MIAGERFVATVSIGVLLVAALACAGCGGASDAPPGENARVVRILPFEVVGQDEDADFVGWAFARSLASGIAQAGNIRVLEVPEGRAPEPGEPDGSEPSHVVSGTLSRDGAAVHARLELVAGAHRSPTWETEAGDQGGDLSRLASGLSEEVVRALGVPVPDLYDYLRDVDGGPEMSASPLTKRARDAWTAFDLEEFREASREVADRFPDDPAAHFLNVWALVYSWDTEPSSETLNLLRERLAALNRVDPSSPYDELMRGFVYRSSGEPGLATEMYSQVLARTDLTSATRAWAHRQRSITDLQRGNADAARADAEEAVRLDPANASSLFALSKALEAMDELDEAIVRSRQALALTPFAWRQHQRLGIVYSRAGMVEDAILSLERACDLSSSQEACANHAVTLMKAGKRPEALAALEHAGTLSGTPFGAYNIACAWSLAGEKSRALDALHEAVKLGFADALITDDPDLDALRGDPEFQEILLDVEESLRSRRERSLSAFPWQA
jgi:tetratricopeptide (TPR) repeat protein